MTTASNVEVMIGSVLGETYEIVRVLGEGGMGAVWEASHLRLPGKRFAVKVLHTQVSADKEAYARFRREAEIASRIGHPNIIEVLDWNTLPSGAPYLVLEYLDGHDLAGRLQQGPLPVHDAIAIARQIGSALKAAHAADVVHRDLKPANVFLVPREVDGVMVDHVKVLDFGISKIRNSQTVQTQDAVLLGTPQYMAPEQALGKNHEIDGRTDIFALGAIVYEMIAGRPPFVGTTLAEVVFKVVYEPIVPLTTLVPDVPPEIAAAVDRAMQKSAADRFPDVSSFILALTGRGLATSDRKAVPVTGATPVPPTNERTAQDPSTEGPASHLRGEMHAAPAPARNRPLLFLIVAIVVGAGGAYGAIQILGKKPPPPMVAIAPPPVAPIPVAPIPVPTPVEPKTPPHDIKHDAPKVVHETLSPEAADLLDQAEQALTSGDHQGARNLADRSMRVQKSARAYAVLTRAHCSTGDLGNARATWQHVVGSDKARVRKECSAHGVDLP